MLLRGISFRAYERFVHIANVVLIQRDLINGPFRLISVKRSGLLIICERETFSRNLWSIVNP